MVENEEFYWELIKELQWNSVGGYNYKNKGLWLYKHYHKDVIEELSEFVTNKRRELQNRLLFYSRSWGMGDDGFWDLVAHIIGQGKHEFYNVMADPTIAKKRADKRDFKENFQYIFHYSEEVRKLENNLKYDQSLVLDKDYYI